MAVGAAVLCLGCGLGCNKLWGVDDLRYHTSGAAGAGGGAGSTATGTTSTGAAGSGAAAGAGGGGTGTGSENCLNGIDDDGDQLEDCDDADCSTFQCAAPPPTGWRIGWLREPAGACPPLFPESVELHALDALDPAAPTCNCTCSGVMPCKLSLRCYSASGCPEPDTWAHGVTGVCSNDPNPNPGGTSSCWASEPFPDGACPAPGGTNPASPAWSWPVAALACLRSGGGTCGDTGDWCIPTDSSGDEPCLFVEGDEPCPDPYSAKSTYYEGGYSVAWTCPCSCDGNATGCDCSGAGCGLNLWDGGGCSGAADVFLPGDRSCVSFSAASSTLYSSRGSGVPLDSPCEPVAAHPTPTPSVDPGPVLTVCCRP